MKGGNDSLHMSTGMKKAEVDFWISVYKGFTDADAFLVWNINTDSSVYIQYYSVKQITSNVWRVSQYFTSSSREKKHSIAKSMWTCLLFRRFSVWRHFRQWGSSRFVLITWRRPLISDTRRLIFLPDKICEAKFNGLLAGILFRTHSKLLCLTDRITCMQTVPQT